MPSLTFKTATLPGCDTTIIESSKVVAAKRISLPFRLRVGSFRKFPIGQAERFEIYCLNRFPSEKLEEYDFQNRLSAKEFDELHTEVLLVDYEPRLDAGVSEEIQGQECSFISLNIQATHAALSRFLMAYDDVQEIWHMDNLVENITLRQFLNIHRCDYRVLCPAGHRLTDDQAMAFFDDPIGESTRWPMLAFDDDLSEERLNQIPQVALGHEVELFHEFAYLARLRLFQHEHRVALLMAVIALEAVHGKLLRWELERRLIGSDRNKRKIIDNYFREQGFYTLNQLTPSLYLHSSERPTDDEMNACLAGIQMRNAIMHGNVGKDGLYKMGKYDAKSLADAHAGVTAVYQKYESALTARLENRQEVD